MSNQAFSATEAAKLANLPYWKVDRIARSRIVTPSARDTHGTGTARRYALKDIIALRAVSELQACGIGTRGIKQIVSFLREQGTAEPVLTRRLIVTGGTTPDVVLVETDEEFVNMISTLRAPGQVVLRIGELAQEVSERAAELVELHATGERADVA